MKEMEKERMHLICKCVNCREENHSKSTYCKNCEIVIEEKINLLEKEEEFNKFSKLMSISV